MTPMLDRFVPDLIRLRLEDLTDHELELLFVLVDREVEDRDLLISDSHLFELEHELGLLPWS